VLCSLWEDLLGPASVEPLGTPPQDACSEALAQFETDESSRIVVAETDGDVVGCAFLRKGLVSPVAGDRVVHVSHVQVDPDYEGKGIARSLVEAGLTWAEQLGVGTIVVATAASNRESNRFLARLGLAPMASLRGSSVAALRARLSHVGPAAAARKGGPRRSVDQVVAARRSQRARKRQIAV
jgi:GNAT superfamily N-acetyltransferase